MLLRLYKHTLICLQTIATEDRIVCAVTCTALVRMVSIVDWSLSFILIADEKKEKKAEAREGKRDAAEM